MGSSQSTVSQNNYPSLTHREDGQNSDVRHETNEHNSNDIHGTQGAVHSPSNSNSNSNNRTTFSAFHSAQTILAAYDRDGNQSLDAQELEAALKDYQHQAQQQRQEHETEGPYMHHTPATKALAMYDHDADGTIQGDELQALYTDMDTSETALKYLAFCGSLSTMGKVVRAIHAADGREPPSSKLKQMMISTPKTEQSLSIATKQIRHFWNGIRGHLVRGSWRVTYAYALVDTCWEGYKQSLDGNYEQRIRHIASRASFHASMIVCSMYTVKWTVQGAYAILPRNRWASILGAAAPPAWVLPCALSTAIVLQIPTLIAPTVKHGLREIFGAQTGRFGSSGKEASFVSGWWPSGGD